MTVAEADCHPGGPSCDGPGVTLRTGDFGDFGADHGEALAWETVDIAALAGGGPRIGAVRISARGAEVR